MSGTRFATAGKTGAHRPPWERRIDDPRLQSEPRLDGQLRGFAMSPWQEMRSPRGAIAPEVSMLDPFGLRAPSQFLSPDALGRTLDGELGGPARPAYLQPRETANEAAEQIPATPTAKSETAQDAKTGADQDQDKKTDKTGTATGKEKGKKGVGKDGAQRRGDAAKKGEPKDKKGKAKPKKAAIEEEEVAEEPHIATIPDAELEPFILPRSSLRDSASVPSFEAPPVPSFPSARASPGKPAPPPRDKEQAIAVFRDAIAAARRLHDDLVADATRAVAKAGQTSELLAGRRQEDLDRGLDQLSDRLRNSRLSLDQAADAATAMVDVRESETQVAITRAANSAWGTLNAAKSAADDSLKTEVTNRDDALDTGKGNAATVKKAGDDAAAKVTGLVATREQDHPTKGDPLIAAINEAINDRLPDRAPKAASTYSDEGSAESSSLTSTVEQMRTGLEAQFTTIKTQMTSTAASTNESIGKAKRAALKQLTQSANQARNSIATARASGHGQLVQQHNQSRRQLISAQRDRARSEDQSAQQRATRGENAATGIAAGQRSGAKSLADNIARERNRTPDDFAKLMQSSANTTMRHVNKAGVDQRARVQRSAEAGETAAERQAGVSGARLAGTAGEMANRLESGGQSTRDQLSQRADQAVAPFAKLPDPINQALKSAQPSVKKAYGSAITNAQDLVTKTKTGLSNAMAGKSDGPPANGAGTATPAPTPAPAPGAKEGAKGAKEIPNEFVKRAGGITAAPLTDKKIDAMITAADKTIRDKVISKVHNLHEALVAFSTPVLAVMAELRSITALQGSALSDNYQHRHGKNLELELRTQLIKAFSADSTNDFNIDAAVNYLHGNHVAAAMSEMKAAVNYSNDEGRVEAIQRSLSPKELGELNAEHPDEMAAVLEDLDGNDKKISTELNKIRPPASKDDTAQQDINLKALGFANSFSLQKDIDAARKKEGEEGGDAVADAVEKQRANIGGDLLSGGDALGPALEDPDEAKLRREKIWKSTDDNFATAVDKLPDGSPNIQVPGEAPLSGIARYAAAKRSYDEFVPDNSEYGGHYETKQVGLDKRQAHLIDSIVHYGSDSEEAAAATLSVELNRTGKPKEDRLRKGMGSDLLAAREGESDEQRRERLGINDKGEIVNPKGDMQKSVERRESILRQYAQLEGQQRSDAALGTKESAAEAGAIKQQVVSKLGEKLAGDPSALAYTKSMVENLEPDPKTAFEFALKHEDKNKETLIATASRLNRKQIDEAVGDWDIAHPGEPLYKKLGMFEQGSGVLEGDARNDVELKFMGVPTNDMERAEVANMATKQQIRDSGFAGRGMAHEEFQRMVDNQTKLLEIMGVKPGDIDAKGRINIKNRGPHGDNLIGHFDAKGNLVIQPGGTRSEFEAAMQLSSINADEYKSAVDRVAAGVTMALMIVAAAITTFVTFGGAAAIWGPILVTAGAGLVGIAMSAAIKGDRYTKAELERDLVMTFVQAATAGLGAYAGTALRGAGTAAKAAATSEKVLGTMAGVGEKQALSFGAKAMNFGKNVLIDSAVGGTSNAINSSVGAAMDPENRRKGISGQMAYNAGIKSFAGGAMAAAIGKPLGGLAKPFGKGAERVLGNVASGYVQRVTESRVGQGLGEAHQSWGESLEGAKEGIAQDALTAIAEHGSEHFAEGRAERKQQARVAARSAAAEEPGAPAAPRATSEEGPALRPESDQPQPTGEDPRHTPESAARAQAAREALPPDVRGSLDEALPQKPAGSDPQHEAPLEPPRAAPPEPEPPAPRTALPAPEEAVPHAIGRSGESEGGSGKTIAAANDNGPGDHRLALAGTDMIKLGPIPEGSVFVHPESRSREAANDNFGRMIQADPAREVAVYRNPLTGEFVVIQGGATVVGAINAEGKLIGKGTDGRAYAWAGLLDAKGGHWLLEHHYHPNAPGELGTALSRRLPSGAGADFGVVVREATHLGHDERSSRIYYIDNGKISFTDFGINTKSTGGKYWVEFPEPGSGNRVRHEFPSLEKYHGFVTTAIGEPYPMPKGFVEPVLGTIQGGQPRVVDGSAGPHTLAPADRASVEAVIQRAGAGRNEEAQAMASRMGLVEQPGAAARLQQVVGDDGLPVESRKALVDTAQDAAQKKLVASGEIGPEDKLVLLPDQASQRGEKQEALRKVGADGGATESPEERAAVVSPHEADEAVPHAIGTKGDDEAPATTKRAPAEENVPGAKRPVAGVTEPRPAVVEPPAPAKVNKYDAFEEMVNKTDPKGPEELIKRIKAGGPDGEAAQAELNKQSNMPTDGRVVNISQAELERQLPADRSRRQQVRADETSTGWLAALKARIYRSRITGKNTNPMARIEGEIPHRKPGEPVTVYQFEDGGLRVWRDESNRLVQEAVARPGISRQGAEDQNFSHGESNKGRAEATGAAKEAGLRGGTLERAHQIGPGLGIESPFGIGYAPREVNQKLQNEGIEQYLRDIRDRLPEGATLIYKTTLEMNPSTNRQAKIGYEVFVVINGERHNFVNFGITIDGAKPFTKPSTRKGTVRISVDEPQWPSHRDGPTDLFFKQIKGTVPVPHVLEYGMTIKPEPSGRSILNRLRGMTPEAVAKGASENPERFPSARPDESSKFNAETWHDQVKDLLQETRGSQIIVDLRELNLTPAQLAELDSKINLLKPRDRMRLLILR